ncbi:sensor histidine kinase [Engelhardtia mirabilis]|uniref:histidine kinase n=1 Tax=Engelhardtia mirabilis TaxID=2528011 RepID=A0A518BQ24_9BACT|nr:Alkaline phosphatase synthesis sensor protein PhoR [Planctomycetes bacterium Pla133]QDV03387.1 Alkaline phosphatase synthesis sensor protein PhoR [Planctomycetes bacterium Pla86]
MRTPSASRRAPYLLGAVTFAAVGGLALVLGVALARFHRADVAAARQHPIDVARTIREEWGARFHAALAREQARSPFVFAPEVLAPVDPDHAIEQDISPLDSAVGEPGILAYFGEEFLSRDVDATAPRYFLASPHSAPSRLSGLQAVAAGLVWRWASASPESRKLNMSPMSEHSERVVDVATFLGQSGRADARQMLSELERARKSTSGAGLTSGRLILRRGPSRLELLPSSDDDWYPTCWWQIRIRPPVGASEGLSGLNELRSALTPDGVDLIQGVLFDLDWWVTDGLLAVSEGLLDEDESLRFAPAELPEDSVHQELDLLAAMDCERPPDAAPDTGRVTLVRDLGPMRRAHRTQWTLYAAGLLGTLGLVGAVIVPTTRRLQRDLRRAQRTGDFVAAVTHELRTPISTIALHIEMLLDGWVEDPDTRAEYYRRIDAETARLARLVERILEQSRLTRGRTEAPGTEPEPGDLSEAVRRQVSSLEAGAPAGVPDLTFELAQDLPAVLLSDEAVESVVTNLVENARKYAPFDPALGPQGRILVRTKHQAGAVVLEVSDRGPGIPAGEQERIFEAFYRVGSEATRTTTGTGLGLHLVDLQVRSLGGRVEALPREGGGAVLRVTLPAV